MKISFLTVVRNPLQAGRADAFRNAVKSVADCPIPHEHVVVDGASTDGTVALLGRFAAEFPGFRFISEPDHGIYDALNKGVKLAQGEWIHVLGCDDWICRPEALAAVVAVGEQKQADILITPVEKSCGGRTVNLKSCLYSIPYCHQGVLMRRTLIERLGGFDASLKLAGDYALTLRAHLSGAREVVVPRVFAHYATGGASSNWAKLQCEIADVARSQFCLSERETRRFLQTKCLPVRILLPLLLHRRGVVRKGAFWQLARNVACVLMSKRSKS